MSDTRTPSSSHATASLNVEPEGLRSASCPMCHTTAASLTLDSVAAGGAWRCSRCGQHWDAARLANVAAYAAWTVERETATGRLATPERQRERDFRL